MSRRFDLYAPIHKALRHCMGATLVQLGSLDLSDEQEVRRCAAALHTLVDWLESHLNVEERFVHSALAARRDSALLFTLRSNHEAHERSFALLRRDADALLTTLR